MDTSNVNFSVSISEFKLKAETLPGCTYHTSSHVVVSLDGSPFLGESLCLDGCNLLHRHGFTQRSDLVCDCTSLLPCFQLLYQSLLQTQKICRKSSYTNFSLPMMHINTVIKIKYCKNNFHILLTINNRPKSKKKFDKKNFALCGARTHDPEIKSLMLYRLS